jgi:hypothetical protein
MEVIRDIHLRAEFTERVNNIFFNGKIGQASREDLKEFCEQTLTSIDLTRQDATMSIILDSGDYDIIVCYTDINLTNPSVVYVQVFHENTPIRHWFVDFNIGKINSSTGDTIEEFMRWLTFQL